MPDIERPDGAVIHYDTFGSGYPLLLIALGGVSSEARAWGRSAINPIEEFSDEFKVIAMDQRHAGQSWNVPEHFSYDDSARDQLAVLDDLGIDNAHVWGGCIGVGYLLRLIQEAPARITAGVGQDPVGLDDTNDNETFWDMFRATIKLAHESGTEAVVREALVESFFAIHNEGGPYAPRIEHDPEFRARVEAMSATEYETMIEAFAHAIWPANPPYFTVDEDSVRACRPPLLILPGSDAFHPTSVAHKICAEAPDARCLDVDCRSDEKIGATRSEIRAFLHAAAGD